MEVKLMLIFIAIWWLEQLSSKKWDLRQLSESSMKLAFPR